MKLRLGALAWIPWWRKPANNDRPPRGNQKPYRLDRLGPGIVSGKQVNATSRLTRLSICNQLRFGDLTKPIFVIIFRTLVPTITSLYENQELIMVHKQRSGC